MHRGRAGRKTETTHLDKETARFPHRSMSQASPWGLGPGDRNSDAIIPFINLSIHSTNTLAASAISLSQPLERQQ